MGSTKPFPTAPCVPHLTLRQTTAGSKCPHKGVVDRLHPRTAMNPNEVGASSPKPRQVPTLSPAMPVTQRRNLRSTRRCGGRISRQKRGGKSAHFRTQGHPAGIHSHWPVPEIQHATLQQDTQRNNALHARPTRSTRASNPRVTHAGSSGRRCVGVTRANVSSRGPPETKTPRRALSVFGNHQRKVAARALITRAAEDIHCHRHSCSHSILAAPPTAEGDRNAPALTRNLFLDSPTVLNGALTEAAALTPLCPGLSTAR